MGDEVEDRDAAAVLREAEDFLRTFTRGDLTYRDNVTIGGSIEPDEYVEVATYGAADELCDGDDPEEWPIRVGVHSADGDYAGAYLSIVEAGRLCRAIRQAIRRAKTYPQPKPPAPTTEEGTDG